MHRTSHIGRVLSRHRPLTPLGASGVDLRRSQPAQRRCLGDLPMLSAPKRLVTPWGPERAATPPRPWKKAPVAFPDAALPPGPDDRRQSPMTASRHSPHRRDTSRYASTWNSGSETTRGLPMDTRLRGNDGGHIRSGSRHSRASGYPSEPESSTPGAASVKRSCPSPAWTKTQLHAFDIILKRAEPAIAARHMGSQVAHPG